MAVPQGPAGGLEDGVDTVGTGDSFPQKGAVRCDGINQNVCEDGCSLEVPPSHPASYPCPGTQLSPLKGLARNSQGNVQSLSLVWQKAQLGTSPLLSGGPGKYGS